MRASEIWIGRTYRFKGDGGRELKPRTVVAYDPGWPHPGGRVISHTGRTRSGTASQNESMAGDYFAEHAEEWKD